MPTIYSQAYGERGPAVRESSRARERFAGFVDAFFVQLRNAGVDDYLAVQLRVKFGWPVSADVLTSAAFFFRKAIWDDVVDGLTVFWVCCGPGNSDGSIQRAWVSHVNDVFESLNLVYRMTNDGSVHPHVDAEFSRVAHSALAALDAPRFAQARADFSRCQEALRSDDGLGAVRAITTCAETTFKVLFPDQPRLGSAEIEKALVPAISSRARMTGSTLNATRRLSQSFKDWADTSHQFRHGQGEEEEIILPSSLVAAFIGTGTAFIRWMIDTFSN